MQMIFVSSMSDNKPAAISQSDGTPPGELIFPAALSNCPWIILSE